MQGSAGDATARDLVAIELFRVHDECKVGTAKSTAVGLTIGQMQIGLVLKYQGTIVLPQFPCWRLMPLLEGDSIAVKNCGTIVCTLYGSVLD